MMIVTAVDFVVVAAAAAGIVVFDSLLLNEVLQCL